MATLKDNWSTVEGGGGGGLSFTAAETFIATESYRLDRLDLFFITYGPGTASAWLYSVNGDHKPQYLLASFGTVTVTESDWAEFSEDSYDIEEETEYAIVTTISDVYAIGYGNTYDNGQSWGYIGEEWTTHEPKDWNFRCYTFEPLPGKPKNPTPSNALTDIVLGLETIEWESGS